MTEIKNKIIVLVGMMGSGKTTVAKKLANVLNFISLDSDIEIEKNAGMSISEIFEDFGEEHFRGIEKRIIRKILLYNSDLVLSIGGGAFSDEDIRNFIIDNSLSIWLNASFDNLCNRLLKNKKSRPLLKNNNWKKKLKKLLIERETNYKRAHLEIKVDNMNVNEVVAKIIKSINNHDKYAQQ
tara:strand:- start:2527 stop:3072 length:546 start_codon:yes stop_codon:yes gene_type:complete